MLQVQDGSGGPKKYNGPADAVRKVYREGGIRSVYRGSVLTLLRGKTS